MCHCWDRRLHRRRQRERYQVRLSRWTKSGARRARCCQFDVFTLCTYWMRTCLWICDPQVPLSLTLLYVLTPLGSRLNGTTGGRTQMSSIITGILIVLSIFFLLPWLHFLPKVSHNRRYPLIIRLYSLRLWCWSYMPVSSFLNHKICLTFSPGRSSS
jgi:hypothetical protein